MYICTYSRLFVQPVGFVVLIVGLWLYNDVIIRPLLLKFTGRNKSADDGGAAESKPKADPENTKAAEAGEPK